MMRYIFFALLIFLAYRFIFGFIIPVYRTTRQVKRQFRDVQERMQEQYNNANIQEEEPKQYQSKTGGSTAKVGDYIDFEEIK
jgi:predicted Holliday junction resolvase-like endonuclease